MRFLQKRWTNKTEYRDKKTLLQFFFMSTSNLQNGFESSKPYEVFPISQLLVQSDFSNS